MIYRLTYKNNEGIEARVDIQKGDATIVEVEGTADPFLLIYSNDKNDKSGYFITTSAEINIYETTSFNIDTLKTSSEVDISVKYYINNVLNWTGFVIPDFFTESIDGGVGVVSMVASDRIGTLKNATLSDLPSQMTIKELAVQCLAKTGLSLPLKMMADFSNGTNVNDLFNSSIYTQRFYDTKGRSISCYDILLSILVLSNSKLVQRDGTWIIMNKYQHETGVGNLWTTDDTFMQWADIIVNFDSVTAGAQRTIVPVAASVGVYHEHGGGRLHPDNYDFVLGSSGWIASGGFSYGIENRQIVKYVLINNVFTAIYGDIDKNRLKINEDYKDFYTIDLDTLPYVKTTFPVISTSEDSVNIDIDLSATGMPTTSLRVIILAEGNNKRLAYNKLSGSFEIFDPNQIINEGFSDQMILLSLEGVYSSIDTTYYASTKSKRISTQLSEENINNFNITIRIYGTSEYNGSIIPIFVDFASVRFSNTDEIPKGTIYKTIQGANFTKSHDIDTTLFGDYITTGLNGYFYSYPIDDTSSLLKGTSLTTPTWTAPDLIDPKPILQLGTKQRAQIFSVAHDIVKMELTAQTLDPLSMFVDCDLRRYTLVSGEFDFLRSTARIVIEEAAYASTVRQDFIYSYFGEGEESISSVGGVSGGSISADISSHTHDNMDALNMLSLDEFGKLKINTDVYSTGEISAYGAGDGTGTGSVTALAQLTDVALTSPVSGNVLIYDGTHWINQPQSVGSTSLAQLTDVTLTSPVNGNILIYNGTDWVNQPQSAIVPDLSAYATISYVDGQISTHTHTFASITSKPTTLSGYGITNAVTTNTTQTISGTKTFSTALTASVSVTSPKLIFAAGGFSIEQSGTELLFKYNGVTKQKMLSNGSIVATGEFTAYVASI